MALSTRASAVRPAARSVSTRRAVTVNASLQKVAQGAAVAATSLALVAGAAFADATVKLGRLQWTSVLSHAVCMQQRREQLVRPSSYHGPAMQRANAMHAGSIACGCMDRSGKPFTSMLASLLPAGSDSGALVFEPASVTIKVSSCAGPAARYARLADLHVATRYSLLRHVCAGWRERELGEQRWLPPQHRLR
jgi:hypothetical protein